MHGMVSLAVELVIDPRGKLIVTVLLNRHSIKMSSKYLY